MKVTFVINVLIPEECDETKDEPAVLHDIVPHDSSRKMWVDRRPPMSSKYHNRHEEYVASGECPKVWYGVL